MSDITLSIDHQTITVPAGTTILQAAARIQKTIPTICYHPHFTPPSLCRMCVVEVEKSRVLVQACSRECENGMIVRTDTSRVRQARKVILELLASAVDVSDAPDIQQLVREYGADMARFAEGKKREHPLRDDNPFYIRDYAKCILCWRCVQACGEDVQWTFAITQAGRGFDTRIATFFDQPIPETTCVYCGNCVQACPTGALKAKREFWIETGRDVSELVRHSRLEKHRTRGQGDKETK
ncbi:MAG: (2Fe-2S)-binding protein [Chloroflexi bacterium]|nr:(2Fe-2S)-binding protein [Chloroflexota bacterium]